jgi:hypothetical protein
MNGEDKTRNKKGVKTLGPNVLRWKWMIRNNDDDKWTA